MLYLIDHEMVEYAKTFGCIERKTWKLLDARSQGQSVEAAAYMNESLWPNQEAADAITQAGRTEVTKPWWDEILGGIEIVKTVRYIDEEG